jgi:hypothetical protein
VAETHGGATSASYFSSRAGMDKLEMLDSAGDGADGAAPASAGAAAGGGQVEPSVKGWEGAPLALGAGISPLGLGVSVARSITRSTDIRLVGNFFGYSLTLENSGVSYTGNINFRSAHAQVDWAPFRRRSFHISPGVIFANGNQLHGNGTVPGGTSITVNDTDYYSDPADPLRGTGAVTFNRVGPMVTAGWGSWIPRREKHFSFPIEIGFAYTGEPKIGVNVVGSVCEDPQGIYCSTVNTDPTFQENLNAQIKKLENDISVVRFFPIISCGVAYKF